MCTLRNNFWLCTHTCVCVCMCDTCMCKWLVGIHVCGGPKLIQGPFFVNCFSSWIFWDRISLVGHGAHRFRYEGLPETSRAPSVHPSLRLYTNYVGVRDLKSGSHVAMASLPTNSPSRLSLNTFVISLTWLSGSSNVRLMLMVMHNVWNNFNPSYGSYSLFSIIINCA